MRELDMIYDSLKDEKIIVRADLVRLNNFIRDHGNEVSPDYASAMHRQASAMQAHVEALADRMDCLEKEIRFRIPVPGDLHESEMYGQSYYAIRKQTGELSIVGIDAAAPIANRYNFWFTMGTAFAHKVDKLPREYEGEEE